MPIYEYLCKSCEAEFDELVRMGTPDAEIECPSCGKHEAKRKLSLFASCAGHGGGFGAGGGGASGCGSSGFT